jgi:hypothetical protein
VPIFATRRLFLLIVLADLRTINQPFAPVSLLSKETTVVSIRTRTAHIP